jgi:CheY-like chemotaxis protein
VVCRILIVDDSEPFRRTVGELLAARGFEPLDAVADGVAALAAVSGDCPDGVLLDIHLPGRDGFAVAASIASVCPAAAIVLTSSDIDAVPSADSGTPARRLSCRRWNWRRLTSTGSSPASLSWVRTEGS